jgi:hypothetical protein
MGTIVATVRTSIAFGLTMPKLPVAEPNADTSWTGFADLIITCLQSGCVARSCDFAIKLAADSLSGERGPQKNVNGRKIVQCRRFPDARGFNRKNMGAPPQVGRCDSDLAWGMRELLDR